MADISVVRAWGVAGPHCAMDPEPSLQEDPEGTFWGKLGQGTHFTFSDAGLSVKTASRLRGLGSHPQTLACI